jgi:anti-sigma factor RsiW
MSCKEFVELVTDYLEDALTPEERLRFEEHLTICPGCVTYVDQMRSTIHAVGSLREDDVPDEARDALLHAFRDWKRG